MKRMTLLVLVFAAACGSKQTAPATSTTTSEPMANNAGEHAEMKNMPPELGKFHDVLAPHWHAEKGPQRMKDTCAALQDFHADADAVAKATPPRTTNADTWTTGTKQLVAAVAELDTTCKASDATQFEVAFQKVHESFHGLLALAGGAPMERHEEHEMEHGEHAK